MDEFIQRLDALLEGKNPQKLDTSAIPDEKEKELADRLNRLFECLEELRAFALPLSKGILKDISIKPKNFLGSPLKALHSSLMHLTWQAGEVAKGDYSQRVDFMGDFSEAFNSMVISLATHEKLLRTKISELESALGHIKKLEGILPICANCKKIRIEGAKPEDQNSWIRMENYIENKTEAQFSHGICPQCMEKLYPPSA